MARFSARPTMPPSAMCASFSSSVRARYLSVDRARHRVGIGVVVRQDDERTGPLEHAAAGPRAARASAELPSGGAASMARRRRAVHRARRTPDAKWRPAWHPALRSVAATVCYRRRHGRGAGAILPRSLRPRRARARAGARHGASARAPTMPTLLRVSRGRRPRRSRTAWSRRPRATSRRASACASSPARAAATPTPTRSRSSASSSRRAPRATSPTSGSDAAVPVPSAAGARRTTSTRSTRSPRRHAARRPGRAARRDSTRPRAPTTRAITNVLASIGIEQRIVLVATPDGLLVGDVRPLVRLSRHLHRRAGRRRQQGTARRRRPLRVRRARSTAAPSASRARPRARRSRTSTPSTRRPAR